MGIRTLSQGNARVEFTAGEVSGALGDSITVLPIAVALCALTPLSLPHVLLWFGVFQVVWGVRYGVPISVEPMKALAGLAIAGTLTHVEFLVAGLVVGGVLLVAGTAGALTALARHVGPAAIRGVQLAVALLLARSAVTLALADPRLALAAATLGGLVAVAGYGRSAPLVVLGAGLVVALSTSGVPEPTLPSLSVATPLAAGTRPTLDALGAAAGQLAMSVGNAAVATAALCTDLFDHDVSPDSLAESMGVTTLVAVPLGGLPMCHGSGGLAGKHAFGARTGGANVVLGVLYVLAALVAGVVRAFPTAVLGALLAAVALHLARAALASADATRERVAWGAVGVVGLLTSVGVAFVCGAVLDRLLDRVAPEPGE